LPTLAATLSAQGLRRVALLEQNPAERIRETRASATPMKTPHHRGRPKGSTVPLERHRQKFAIAMWHGVHLYGVGPYLSARWAAWLTSNEPIRAEDVEGLLTVSGTEIKFTASTLDKHIDRLARTAERYALDSNPWLHKSALAIKGLIIAARTRNIEVYCGMLDVLIDLGWRGQIERLRARVEDLIRSNIPPREGKLGREGQGLLDWLRTVADEKPK
jgi:hypothetical protein